MQQTKSRSSCIPLISQQNRKNVLNNNTQKNEPKIEKNNNTLQRLKQLLTTENQNHQKKMVTSSHICESKSSVIGSDKEGELEEITGEGGLYWDLSEYEPGNLISLFDIRLMVGLKLLPPTTTSRTTRSKTPPPWVSIFQIDDRWKYIYKTQNALLAQVYVKECGQDGDCLFHVLRYGFDLLFRKVLDPNQDVFSMMEIRRLAAQCLTVERWDNFILTFEPPKIVQRLPTVQAKVDATKVYLSKPGVWGSLGVLQLLLHSPPFKHLHIGFAVLSIRNRPIPDQKDKKIIKTEPHAYTHIIRLKTTKHLMFLYSYEDKHYLLAGVGLCPAVAKNEKCLNHNEHIYATFPTKSYPFALFPHIREK